MIFARSNSTMMGAKCWLSNISTLPHFSIGTWHSVISKSPPISSSHFFIHLCMINMDLNIPFSLASYSSLLSLLLMFKLSLIWPLGIPSDWLLCPSYISHWLFVVGFFVHTFSTFWHNKIFQVYLLPALLCLWNHPFLQGALVPFIGEHH